MVSHCFLSFFLEFAVISCSHSTGFAEALREIALRGESCEMCNIWNPIISIFQKFLAHFDAFPVQIIDRRNPIIFCKFMTQIILIKMTEFWEVIQSNIFPVIGVKITLNMSALFTWMLGGDQFKWWIRNAPKLQDQNIQHMTADGFISFRLSVQLLKQRIKVK